MKKSLETACTYDCPDACALLVEIDGGEVRLRGHPDHPVTRGFLCRRIRRHLERLRSASRLRQPLARDGAGFREITWPEAFDRAARALEDALRRGAETVVHVPGGGSLGLRKLLVSHFFHSLGAVTTLSGGVCDECGVAAQRLDFGDHCAHDYTDLENSAAVVLWGKNPSVTGVHLLPFIRKARNAGATIVLVDLWRTPTANEVDHFLPIAPGGDGLLAAAVLKLLIQRGRLDAKAVAGCENFSALEALLRLRRAAELADASGSGLEAAEFLSSIYGGAAPVATWIGWGLQRRTRGGLAVRWLDALCLLSGHVGRPGAGANYNPGRKRGLDLSALRPATGRSIDIPHFADALSGLQPPARFLYLHGANPATQFADSLSLREALRGVGYLVVADAFFTDTAACADLILPTTLMLEEGPDAVGSYGHHWVCRVKQALSPPSGPLEDVEIVRRLAARLGLKEDPLLADPEATLENIVRPWFGGRRVPFCRNPSQPEVPFAAGFATASGKARLAEELPSLPLADRQWPLLLLSPKVREFEHSQRQPVEQGEPFPCFVHPQAARGFSNGELARLCGQGGGELQVRLVFRPDLHPQVCAVPEGGWPSLGRGVNILVRQAATDLGTGTAFYDQRVRLEKSQG